MALKYLDTSFDRSFSKVEGLTWLPWIGDKFTSTTPRVLVLGESNYDWSVEMEEEDVPLVKARLKNPSFTRELIEVNHGMNRKSHQRFYRNLERAIFQESYPDGMLTDLFWRSVAHFNLVQRPMENWEKRPTNQDYADAWPVALKVVPIVEATCVLVCGCEFRKYQACKNALAQCGGAIVNESEPRWFSTGYGKHLELHLAGHRFPVVFIKHPSKHFSWEQWGEYFLECAPEVAKLIQRIQTDAAKQ